MGVNIIPYGKLSGVPLNIYSNVFHLCITYGKTFSNIVKYMTMNFDLLWKKLEKIWIIVTNFKAGQHLNYWTKSRVATVSEKILDNENFSRSGKSGNFISSRSNFKLCSWIGHMMSRVLGNISCDLDLDPEVKVRGQGQWSNIEFSCKCFSS